MECNHIAVHEAAHAVAGVCFGRRGLLKKVSIIETDVMKGGCHWDVPPGKCRPGEQELQIAIGFAGPIGQVLYAPHSLGRFHEAFASTILQPNEVLEEAGCAGWASTDLNIVLWLRKQNLSLSPCPHIEVMVKALLSRTSVGKAIVELAHFVATQSELEGATAEQLVGAHLTAADYVDENYLR